MLLSSRRMTFASLPEPLEALLGHSTISVTMRYARTNQEAKVRAVEKVAGSSDKTVTMTF
ncbi:MAG: hypothetical protein LAP39_27550 [Acidobacteriia bacterium]|nr:hypothetical protein [Terriglobia bacterium]